MPMMGKEFCRQGARRVWDDKELWPFFKFEGAIIRGELLVPYVGRKVHVKQFMDGSGFEVSEWLPDAVALDRGRVRSGRHIMWGFRPWKAAPRT